MRTNLMLTGLVVSAWLLTGCMHCCCSGKSRYAADPRARCVGPAYLDYIDQYHPDASTQRYYPYLTVRNPQPIPEWPALPVDPAIVALLDSVPQPSAAVQARAGNGWASLERHGLPFMCGAQ